MILGISQDAWYLMFAGISAIGAACVLSGKILNKYERTGVWIIFGGFIVQIIYYCILKEVLPIFVGSIVIILGVALLISLSIVLHKR